MNETPGMGRPVLWCRHCEEPTRREGGDGPLSKAVHAETGTELCADGEHVAAPTDVPPEMAAIVRRAAADYPRYLVTAVLGVVFHAVLQDALFWVPVEATTEDG